jgi:hypothetical protein
MSVNLGGLVQFTSRGIELDSHNASISLAGSWYIPVKYLDLPVFFVPELRYFNHYRIRAQREHTKIAMYGEDRVVAHQVVPSAEVGPEEDVSELPSVSTRKESVGSRMLLDNEWRSYKISVGRPF